MQSEQRMSGSGRRDTVQKWPHYHSMSFLKDSCLQKITVSNINNEDNSNSSLINDENNAESLRTDPNKGKRKKSDTSSAIERMVDAMCKEDKIVLPAPPEPDEMDSFLSLVGFRLKKMSSRTRFETMQKILQLTYDIIIQEIINE